MSAAPEPARVTGIVILNYNGWRDTIGCLESLMRIGEPIRIIVVDNASPDDSEAQLQAWGASALPAFNAHRVRDGLPPFVFGRVGAGESPEAAGGPTLALIQAGANAGYAAGNNVGMRLALAQGCDFVWILNNDTVVEPDALTWLLARVRAEPRIGLCGSTLVYHARPDIVQALAGSRFKRWRGWGVEIGAGSSLAERPEAHAIEDQLSYINGASTLVTRAFIETVGLMEESYFLYWEEIDWAYRARGRFKLGYAPNSVVHHKVGASIGTRHAGPQSALAEFYMIRGAILFCCRYSWVSLPAMLLGVAQDFGRSALRGDWRRIRFVSRAVAGRHYPADRPGIPKRTAA